MQRLATDFVRSGKRKQTMHIKPRRRIKVENGTSTPLLASSMASVKGVTVSPHKVQSTSVASVTPAKTDNLLLNSPDTISNEGRSYWHEWSHERTWARDLNLIERSCNVSGKVVKDYYKKQLFPSRKSLLELLQKSDIQDSKTGVKRKLALRLSILLQHIAAAAPLMGVVVE